jgi:hypothetical protein
VSQLRTVMLPPMDVTCTDGSYINLQAFRQRAPVVLAFVHSAECYDCSRALEAVAIACKEAPNLRGLVITDKLQGPTPEWATRTVVEPGRIARRLWVQPPSPPVLVLADRYAAVRRVFLREPFEALLDEVRLLEHECPE